MKGGGLLVLVSILSEGITAFGRVLYSPQLLLLAGLYELGKIWVVRTLSGQQSLLASAQPERPRKAMAQQYSVFEKWFCELV